ncbi:2Fe-2S iron-sulfur cluster-binding protein [Nocardioides sp.]|uniref:PDR/VanB family oxidoreductase n=1 Tax=Nocardioides sp. TaxID=35761 RepID=UPI003517E1AF
MSLAQTPPGRTRADTETELDLVVERVETVATDVVELVLRAADGASLPRWEPGAHLDLVLGENLVRQYSLCGNPAEAGHYRVAVLREPASRGGSVAVHALRAGDALRARGPRNHFPLRPGHHYVFIAGGIGITPILTMVESAEAAGASWELHYGGRTTSSMAYAERLAALGDRVRLVPQDTHGLLDLDAVLGLARPDTLVYCCGPEPLLQAVEERMAPWPPQSLHLERFVARERGADDVDRPFDLVLERSGLTLRVEPGVTAFEAMRAAGVAVLGSCLEGICGTCEQAVVEGEVDHRDSVLDAEEQAANDCLMVCVSRAKGDRLVLDA